MMKGKKKKTFKKVAVGASHHYLQTESLLIDELSLSWVSSPNPPAGKCPIPVRSSRIPRRLIYPCSRNMVWFQVSKHLWGGHGNIAYEAGLFYTQMKWMKGFYMTHAHLLFPREIKCYITYSWPAKFQADQPRGTTMSEKFEL